MNLLTENINIKHVYFRDKVFENEEIKSAIDNLSKYLQKNYISDSPFVLLSTYNHVKTLIAFYAILKSGKIPIIVNPGIKAIELSEIINETDPAALILINTLSTDFIYDEEIIFRRPSPIFVIHSNLNDIILIIYTNAEEGKAKAAMITENSLISSIETYSLFEEISKNTIVYSLAPFYHLLGLAYGLLLPCYIGGSVFISDLNLLRINSLILSIKNTGVNYVISVPSFYYLLNKIPDIDKALTNINDFISGGIKLSPQIFYSFLKKTGKIIREGYGLTEASPGVTLSHRDSKINPESIGQVFQNCEIKIINENSEECFNNQVGEIIIRGKNIFKGYLNDKYLTNKVLNNGWLKTGDKGSIDNKGNVYFKGISKNMYNVAGNNVYPKELERLILMNKEVKHVKIFNEKSIVQGDIVGAEIELNNPSEENIKLFKEWCSKNITNYKIPKVWKFSKKNIRVWAINY